MEKSFSDSRKLSRLSTGPIESTDWENSEKRSRFKQRRRFVHPSQQNSQLPEVYANCIKLCNENKINDQNAFGVDLINYMAKMVQEDDSEMNNFQVASCTLDASAKIYGHRVDHVHSETFKMAGSLGRNQENEAPNNQDKSHGSDNSDAPQKKKKNWKGVRTVANVDTITLGKVSEADEVDPLITLMGEIFSEGYGGECLLSVLTSRDDGGQMTSDYDVPYDHENASVLESRCGSVPDIPVLREMVLESLAGHEICLPTKRFSFRDGDNTEILSDDDMQQDFDIDDNGENSNPIPFPDDGADNDVFDDENVVSSNANSGLIESFPRVELMEVLSNVPSEASMFSHNFLTAWAGPDHFSDVESGHTEDHAPVEEHSRSAQTWAVLFTHSGVATASGSVAEPSATRPMGQKGCEKDPLLTSQNNKLLYDSVELLAMNRKRRASQRKSLALVVAVVLVGAMCYSIQAPFYPAKAEGKGITASQYGFVFGIFQLIICITSPIYGKYIAVIGPTFMFNTGIFVTATCTVLFGFLEYSPPQTTFLVLSFVIRIVAAFGESGVYNAAYTLATDTSPTMVATAVSFVETAFGVGAIIGPALGGVLFELGGFVLPFVVTGGVLLLAGVMSTFSLPSVRLEVSKKSRPGVLKALSFPGVIIMSLTIVSCAISSGFNLTLLEPHLRDFNLSAWQVGLVFITNGIVYAATATFWGRMIDKMGKTLVLTTISTLVCSCSYLLLGPAPFIPLEKSLAMVIVSLFLQGAGMGGMVVGAFMGTIHELVGNGFPSDLETHGLASGIFNCAFSTGAFIGPSIAGTLFDTFGFPYASLVILSILTFTTLMLVAFQVYLYKFKRDSKPKLHQSH